MATPDVTCTLWNVDGSDNPYPVGQSPNAADNPTASAPSKIMMVCKGLKITATASVSKYQPSTHGHVYEIGLVQILNASRMKAVYASKQPAGFGQTVCEWSQEKLPCYDSTDDNTIPWYDANSWAQINATGPINLVLKDFPLFHINPYLHRPGHADDGQPLVYAIKHNHFDVYLMMRRTLATDKSRTLERWYFKHCHWETICELEPNANWATKIYDSAGYNRLDHSRRKSWTYKVLPIELLDTGRRLPSRSSRSANAHQEYEMREQYHGLPFARRLK
jgi:hypothetical protein